VAVEAIFGQDGSNVPVKVDGCKGRE